MGFEIPSPRTFGPFETRVLGETPQDPLVKSIATRDNKRSVALFSKIKSR